MQLLAHALGSTEKDSDIGVGMAVPDAVKLHVKIRASEAGPGAQSCHGIGKGTVLVNHQVSNLRVPQTTGQEGVNLDELVQILGFEGQQKRLEPFERLLVSANPEEVDLVQLGRLGGVIDSIPDTLQHTGERCHSDTGSDQHRHLVLKDILRGSSKRPVNHDSGQDCHQSIAIAQTFLPLSDTLCVASEFLGQLLGKVSDDTHVDTDVVLLGCAGKCERVPLPERDLGTAEENVLSSQGTAVVLLDLDLDDLGGVEDDSRDDRLLLGTPFTGETFQQVNKAAGNPVLPETGDILAVRGAVGSEKAESTMEGKEEEEDQEEVMPVPKGLKLLHADRGKGSGDHDDEDDEHNVTGPTWSGDEHQVPEVVLFRGCLGEQVKVAVMGKGVKEGEEDDTPGDGFVEGHGLVEGHDTVEGG